MWAIWTARNKRIHGEKVMTISQACTWGRDMASDLNQSSQHLADVKMQSKFFKWQSPPEGIVKVNVDAAFNSDSQLGATGVVIRGDRDQFIAASCKWITDIPDVLTAEAYACWEGAALVRRLKIPKAIIETDSQELVSLWKTRTNNRSRILPVLNQIQELSRNCTFFDVCHVRREANLAAHLTAKYASPSNSDFVWLDQVPEHLSACIQHDSCADC
jgi:ribonuclease HI